MNPDTNLITNKRLERDISVPVRNAKRRRPATVAPLEEKVQRVVDVKIFNQFEDAAQNVVWMNEEDIKEIFKTATKILLDQTKTPCRYLRIANRVYQVATNNILEPGEIGLSKLQCEEIELDDKTTVSIAPYKIKPHEATKVKKLVFEISANPDMVSMDEGLRFINVRELRQAFRDQFKSNYVVKNQELRFHHNLGSFRVVAKEIQPLVPEHQFGPPKPAQPYGLITENTEIDFRIKGLTNITIIDEEIDTKDYKCFFNISFEKLVDRTSNLVFPLVLDWERMRQLILAEINNKAVTLDHKLTIKYDNVWSFIVRFDKAERLAHIPPRPIDFFKKTYQSSYKFSSETPFELVPPPKDIILAKNAPVIAKAIEVEILAIDKNNQMQLVDQPKYTCVSAEELQRLFKENGAFFLRGQKFYMNTTTGRFLVHIKKPFPRDFIPSDKKLFWKQPMTADQNTEFNFKVNSMEKIILIDNDKPAEVKAITFKVTKAGDDDKGGLNIFLKMLGGEPEEGEQTSVLEKDLLAAAAEQLKKPVILKQPFKIRMKDGTKYRLNPEKIEYESKDSMTIKYSLLSSIIEKSKILFESGGKDLTVINNNADDVCKNPPKSLEELGLGGLAEEFLKIIRLVVMARGNLKIELEKRGVKPTKGLLLSGPPGTGKTTLARHIGRLLGCPEERVILMNGTEVFNKWVGESEKNVRKLFAPAREAYEKLKDKSPLFVIVIDEIEAMVPKRNSDGANKWRDTVVNQFLGEFDGLKELKNVLVIGMTNLPENLDQAVIRPGRFDVHIKFGLPNEKGRKEIFEIHTKKLRENNLLAPDVDLGALAKETDGFSGADIEGLVRGAVSFNIERISKMYTEKPDITSEELNKSPEALLTMKDFEKALRENKSKDSHDAYFEKHIRPIMYG